LIFKYLHHERVDFDRKATLSEFGVAPTASADHSTSYCVSANGATVAGEIRFDEGVFAVQFVFVRGDWRFRVMRFRSIYSAF
jgi:hypothetical protein